MKRRTFSADFKARVAKAALRNDRPIRETASQFEIHPILVSKWKKQASEHLFKIFEDKRSKKDKEENGQEKSSLYEEIGKLKMQLDWLKKKSRD